MLNSPIAASPVLGTPPSVHPAAASGASGNAAEPGAFARELGRAAQDNDADDAAPAPAPANANNTREARAKPRTEADRGKTERTPAQRKADAAETDEVGVDKPRPAGPADADDVAGTPDLHALLASQMNHAAPAPAPGEGASAQEAAQSVTQAEAGAGKAAAAPDRPALAAAADAAPAFALPAATPTLATQHTEAVAAPAPAPYAAQIQAPVGSPDFAPGLSAQVSVMVRDGLQEARLQLNPAEMGPITVQIQVEGNTAQVTMTAEQAPTRDALEQAMPSLAGALREEGLTLTGGGVFEQARQPRGDAAASGAGSRSGSADGAGTDGDDGAAAAPARRVAARGAVDVYA
jgi:flagellar hook-length control protein FliK